MEAQTSSIPAAACWNCRAETTGGHFCPACGKIQPLPRGADYFDFFGLPQKLRIDATELEKRFHQLSWKLHPDNFVRAGDLERSLSLERASELNDAYRTLIEPIRRVEYLLLRRGLRKEGASKQQAPPELLEEVFELNESLDELRSARAPSAGTGAADEAALRIKLGAALETFQGKLSAVDGELERLFAEWDEGLEARAQRKRPGGGAGGTIDGDEAAQRTLARMNEVLNRRSYIRNLVAGVQKELTEA